MKIFWYNFIFVGLTIVIVIIAWFVWKDNYNKEYSDYNFEIEDSIIKMNDIS